jgi:hypothetical protein
MKNKEEVGDGVRGGRKGWEKLETEKRKGK